jgi:hypothetical protein
MATGPRNLLNEKLAYLLGEFYQRSLAQTVKVGR